ncbi:hypothetical protein K449DRAFT_429068 [Hypoxylon sp. EC38]|nr:hypothetical protein K449DRAFT_429068 [Hypoxylon sp. EC38]
MVERAKLVEAGIINLMDLKQKQANLWEARSSREGAEQTARQGQTLMMFTVVTIIFLPLSFTAAFFAISVDQFPRDRESDDVKWPLQYFVFLTLIRRVVGNDYDRNMGVGWDNRFNSGKRVIIKRLAQWHGRLLKELTNHSTRTIPDHLKECIEAATEPTTLFRRIWSPAYSDSNSQMLHEMLRQIGDRKAYNDYGRSMYGNDDYREMALIQEQDMWTICFILDDYGVPIR